MCAPESYVGGNLALVKTGDLITVDVPARRIHLEISDEELAQRRAAWTPPPKRFERGYGHTDYFAWIRQGEKIWIAVGIVPDHIPQLKARDIVELRQTGGTRTVENFATTGEGNIVVRVLCRAADPAYDACVKRQPKIGAFEGYGATGTPYPASAKSYGYTFSPKYDANGKLLQAPR